MGSATLARLIARGVDALGFDPISPADTRGSFHGSCRIFRRFNFENPAYTAFSDRAFAGWRDLEASSGRTVLKPCPLIEAGPPGSPLVAGSRAAAKGASDGPRTGADLNRLYPAFNLPSDWEVAAQDSSGILLADVALDLFRSGARTRIIRQAVRLEITPADLILTAGDGERWSAGRVIVAAGAWVTDFVPSLAPHIEITRQAVGWFQALVPIQARYPAFPLFILEAPEGFIYGFPDFEGRGVKAASHSHGRVLPHADLAAQDATEGELLNVGEVLRAYVPGAAGPLLYRETCLYTNTLGGDLDGSPAEEFILDRLPDDPRVIVASPCSGHGFSPRALFDGPLLGPAAARTHHPPR